MYDFKAFAQDLEQLASSLDSWEAMIQEGAKAMNQLLAHPELVSREIADQINQGEASGKVYQSPEHGFVIHVFTWSPGSKTPIHDHHTWGIMGIYRNSLQVIDYDMTPLEGNMIDVSPREPVIAGEGTIAYVLPPYEEIHEIENIGDDLAISIHVYGKEIDQYNIFDLKNKEIRQAK